MSHATIALLFFLENSKTVLLRSERSSSIDKSQKYRDLIHVLEEFDLACLAEKFAKGGVTTRILWELDEEMLDEIELTKLEKLNYKKASEERKNRSQNHEEKFPSLKKTKNIEASLGNNDMQKNVTKVTVDLGNMENCPLYA